MRYLTDSFAVGALRRGQGIEQFLGPVGSGDAPAVSWVSVEPTRRGFVVMLHTVEDTGGEDFCDLLEFPPLDPDEEFGREIAVVDDPPSAMAVAEDRTGALRGRWVNTGMAGDEYRDYVRAGRSKT
ncbi:hypothetical protein ACLIYM_28275 [Streptomyces fenghuangensis]|uniref:hypothetical protein n=1 Tax=Streptomyces sp. ICN903 TaxID=2964654 RepID=UPI001EDA5630|nr:hypothetical protein [Streptomyces sp. ICN903]MCG3042001.1 hypothetical protein [Streptomyces sp. ICN903]